MFNSKPKINKVTKLRKDRERRLNKDWWGKTFNLPGLVSHLQLVIFAPAAAPFIPSLRGIFDLIGETEITLLLVKMCISLAARKWQECIPVGCVPPAFVTTARCQYHGVSVPIHKDPLSWRPPPSLHRDPNHKDPPDRDPNNKDPLHSIPFHKDPFPTFTENTLSIPTLGREAP